MPANYRFFIQRRSSKSAATRLTSSTGNMKMLNMRSLNDQLFS
jgi:hypothetical protein